MQSLIYIYYDASIFYFFHVYLKFHQLICQQATTGDLNHMYMNIELHAVRNINKGLEMKIALTKGRLLTDTTTY